MCRKQDFVFFPSWPSSMVYLSISFNSMLKAPDKPCNENKASSLFCFN